MSSPSSLAPIVLFTYNRPEHARRTVEALQKNSLAEVSDLIIYSDGPKRESAAARVEELRHYLRTVRGFRSVEVVERQRNVGLAASIISGVTEVCLRYGRVIVMEDDLVTSEHFLEFMNGALDRYVHNHRVMHISGYMYPIDSDDLPETYFLPPASCWGWATWDRAWRHFRKDPVALKATFSATDRRRFNLDNAFPYWSQVEMNLLKEIDTWAIFWYASVFQRGGLCLHPRRSYVQNIGHDNSGQHSDASDAFDVTLNQHGVRQWSDDLDFDSRAFQRLQHFSRRTLPPGIKLKLAAASLAARLQRLLLPRPSS